MMGNASGYPDTSALRRRPIVGLRADGLSGEPDPGTCALVRECKLAIRELVSQRKHLGYLVPEGCEAWWAEYELHDGERPSHLPEGPLAASADSCHQSPNVIVRAPSTRAAHSGSVSRMAENSSSSAADPLGEFATLPPAPVVAVTNPAPSPADAAVLDCYRWYLLYMLFSQ